MSATQAAESSTLRKIGGWELYRDVMRSPKYIVAPMVDQSELPWRILSRRYGAQLVYSPMINAKLFSQPTNTAYRSANFSTNQHDRPLVVQFCANDPDQLLAAAKLVEDQCDAVDVNLGCPQDIARRGRYGAYLMDDWDLVYKLVNILHENLRVPVTAKFRIFPEIKKTVEYAKMLERAGAQILTCHGRLREQKGHKTGLASWAHIRAVKEAVSVPVFANGNILYFEDVERCLRETGADGVMSAEGNLTNPGVFGPSLATAPSPKSLEVELPASSNITDASEVCTTATTLETGSTTSQSLTLSRSEDTSESVTTTKEPETSPSTMTPDPSPPSFYDPAISSLPPPSAVEHQPSTRFALEYLHIVRSLHQNEGIKTSPSSIKGHLFKLMRPALSVGKARDLRAKLGNVGGSKLEKLLEDYEAIVKELDVLLEVDKDPWDGTWVVDEGGIRKGLPAWCSQPFFRPPLPLPTSKAGEDAPSIPSEPEEDRGTK